MAKGRPKRWASAQLGEAFTLGKPGIKIIIWDKWGRTRRGTAIISVGGIRWFPVNAKKPTVMLSWSDLDRLADK